jgi:hypothetical protein
MYSKGYLGENGDGCTCPNATMSANYAEAKQQKWEGDAASAARKVRVMSWRELTGQVTSAGRYTADLQRKGKRRWRWWSWYAGRA